MEEVSSAEPWAVGRGPGDHNLSLDWTAGQGTPAWGKEGVDVKEGRKAQTQLVRGDGTEGDGESGQRPEEGGLEAPVKTSDPS